MQVTVTWPKSIWTAGERTLNGLAQLRRLQARKAHYRYFGGYATKSPVRFAVPRAGHWHVVVDLGGGAGQVRASNSSAQRGFGMKGEIALIAGIVLLTLWYAMRKSVARLVVEIKAANAPEPGGGTRRPGTTRDG